MAEFSFQIEEHLLVLSENDKGWTKELNRVSYPDLESRPYKDGERHYTHERRVSSYARCI